jgi:hypothetical protein
MGDTHCLDMMEYDTVSDITKNTIDSIHDSFSESLYKLDNTKSVLLAKVSLFCMILSMIYIFISVLRILLFSKEIKLPFGFGVRLNSTAPASAPTQYRRSRRSHRSSRLAIEN